MDRTEKDPDRLDEGTTRRESIRTATLGAVALGVGAATAARGAPAPAPGQPGLPAPGRTGPGRYNIPFLLTDQERLFRPGELPAGYSLPAHERLMRRGTTFLNHRINSCDAVALGALHRPAHPAHADGRCFPVGSRLGGR